MSLRGNDIDFTVYFYTSFYMFTCVYKYPKTCHFLSVTSHFSHLSL